MSIHSMNSSLTSSNTTSLTNDNLSNISPINTSEISITPISRIPKIVPRINHRRKPIHRRDNYYDNFSAYKWSGFSYLGKLSQFSPVKSTKKIATASLPKPIKKLSEPTINNFKQKNSKLNVISQYKSLQLPSLPSVPKLSFIPKIPPIPRIDAWAYGLATFSHDEFTYKPFYKPWERTPKYIPPAAVVTKIKPNVIAHNYRLTTKKPTHINKMRNSLKRVEKRKFIRPIKQNVVPVKHDYKIKAIPKKEPIKINGIQPVKQNKFIHNPNAITKIPSTKPTNVNQKIKFIPPIKTIKTNGIATKKPIKMNGIQPKKQNQFIYNPNAIPTIKTIRKITKIPSPELNKIDPITNLIPKIKSIKTNFIPMIEPIKMNGIQSIKEIKLNHNSKAFQKIKNNRKVTEIPSTKPTKFKQKTNAIPPIRSIKINDFKSKKGIKAIPTTKINRKINAIPSRKPTKINKKTNAIPPKNINHKINTDPLIKSIKTNHFINSIPSIKSLKNLIKKISSIPSIHDDDWQGFTFKPFYKPWEPTPNIESRKYYDENVWTNSKPQTDYQLHIHDHRKKHHIHHHRYDW